MDTDETQTNRHTFGNRLAAKKELGRSPRPPCSSRTIRFYASLGPPYPRINFVMCRATVGVPDRVTLPPTPHKPGNVRATVGTLPNHPRRSPARGPGLRYDYGEDRVPGQ